MDKLLQSLQTGFINHVHHSNKEYRPELLINDYKEGKKVLSTINQELRTSDEFWFSVAFLTEGGVQTLLNSLVEFKEQGKKGKILVSQYLNFTQPKALRKLLTFDNIDLRIVTKGNFHSKGYLFKKEDLYKLIIGSSNLTANALSVNKELNIKFAATENSEIIYSTLSHFQEEFDQATLVTEEFITDYEEVYQRQFLKQKDIEEVVTKKVSPNLMQEEALKSLESIREEGKNKSLLISATGTGKTYLSAFDAKAFAPKKLLFVVHRANIAKAALDTFKVVFGDNQSMGMYSGNTREKDADFIFSTIQTISKDEHLSQFNPGYFDYIIIDETHRAGANSYQKILDYFKPTFLLGMTATPERTDGLDIFKLFDYNIAYEIRLHRALAEQMLTPFHYYGVTDLSVDGEVIEKDTDFSLLTANERVDRIIEKALLYGYSHKDVRGLVFCSNINECKELSEQFNKRGYNTLALTGSNSEEERVDAINKLESDYIIEKLDYIFTVDIFNEGIDIPRVNQVIMLRPTQSAIVFVQQLGRGLRKSEGKEHLIVIDFIGNYKNNYLVPIALYGDTSYNKDSLRKLLSTESGFIPGASTINFDKITKEQIFSAINNANMQEVSELRKDYKLLKFKLGKIPMMHDFIQHGSRDPQLYVNRFKSYFNFVISQEEDLVGLLDEKEIKLLECFSTDINNGKRIEESIILQELIIHKTVSIHQIEQIILDNYKYTPSIETIESCYNNLNFGFITEKTKVIDESTGKEKEKIISVQEKYDIQNIQLNNDVFICEPDLEKALTNPIFIAYLKDTIACAIEAFNKNYSPQKFHKGFILYNKYSRKDVFRILNTKSNPIAQNVGGYLISTDQSNCPIFVNYHKADDISSTTKYEDGFIDPMEFEWMSKSNRTLKSKDVQTLKNNETIHLPLFIKKDNDEGTEFYYMGDVKPIKDSFKEKKMLNDKQKEVPVVKLTFSMQVPVEDTLFNYLTNN